MSTDTINNVYKYSKILLLLLLIVDGIFIGLHLSYHNEVGNTYRNFLIDRDNSYAEIFQYFKFIAILIFLGMLIYKYEKKNYFSWFALFAIFLLDDSIGFHERFGWHFSRLMNFQDSYGLRAQDWGELSYVLLVGPALLLLAIYSYKKGKKDFRKRSIDLVFLVGLFLFFGIVVDMLHSLSNGSAGLGKIFTVIEDGGEMIVLSYIVFYISKFSLTLHSKKGYVLNNVYSNKFYDQLMQYLKLH